MDVELTLLARVGNDDISYRCYTNVTEHKTHYLFKARLALTG